MQHEAKMDSNEERRQIMLDTIAGLCRELVAERFSAIEQAAAEVAEDADDEADAKPPVAKINLAVKWQAGAHRPEITVSGAFSVRRKLTVSAETDKAQAKLEGIQ